MAPAGNLAPHGCEVAVLRRAVMSALREASDKTGGITRAQVTEAGAIWDAGFSDPAFRIREFVAALR